MYDSNITDPNIQALRRIVALFLAIAGFAERAAGRSALVRWPVLVVLRPGEAVARDRVERLMRAFGLPDVLDAAEPGPDASGAEQAMQIARSFRRLAAAIATLIEMLAATCAPEETTADDGCAAAIRRGMRTVRTPVHATARLDSS